MPRNNASVLQNQFDPVGIAVKPGSKISFILFYVRFKVYQRKRIRLNCPAENSVFHIQPKYFDACLFKNFFGDSSSASIGVNDNLEFRFFYFLKLFL